VSISDSLPEEKNPGSLTRGVVAAFDLDGTLTRGGSVWKFLVFVAGRTAVVTAGLVDLPKLARAAIVGGKANDSAKEALFRRLLTGRAALEVSRQAASFGLSHFSRRVRPEVRDRLEWHKAQGHRVAVVSASPELYVRAIAAELGADTFIATRLAVQDSALTGRYEGQNCRGAEKERRLREWIAGTAETAESADNAGDPAGPVNGNGGARKADGGAATFVWAYGNSAGDLQMLRSADVGVNVGRLGPLGKLRDFRSLAEVSAGDQPGSDAAPTTRPS
jgi:HAD superfamily hydrolase (TIGR01490 family)